MTTRRQYYENAIEAPECIQISFSDTMGDISELMEKIERRIRGCGAAYIDEQDEYYAEVEENLWREVDLRSWSDKVIFVRIGK